MFKLCKYSMPLRDWRINSHDCFKDNDLLWEKNIFSNVNFGIDDNIKKLYSNSNPYFINSGIIFILFFEFNNNSVSFSIGLSLINLLSYL